MLMFIKLQFFLLLSYVTLSCFGPLTCAQAQLPLAPDEADVLQRIAEKLGAKLQQKWSDPCQTGKLSIDVGQPDGRQHPNNSIFCGYSDGNFSHVTNISLLNLSLQGSLPPELVNLTFLQEIDLTRNYISGNLPKEWPSMRHLDKISLTANRLTGPIPPDWGNFASLTYLTLEANQLSGTIPDDLGNLVYLTALKLSSNRFGGSLPKTLANIRNITDFRVSDNSFNGPVPEFIGSWTKLTRLEMYASGLKGPIPTSIFALGNLEDLRISDMVGPKFSFPYLSNKKMKYLVLRNLNMSGSIPDDTWAINKTIDLTFNKLEGEIFTDKKLETDFIFLSGNLLTGDVPEPFRSAGVSIDLSYNNFTPLSRCPQKRKISMYRSFSSQNNTSGLLSCPNNSSCEKYYRSLHINCGGQNKIINNTMYEGDEVAGNDAPALSFRSGNKWGFVSVGDFMDDNSKYRNGYILSTNSTSLMRYPDLYSTARASPLFLTYYGNCMENGNYTVNLHFAEILFSDKVPFNRVGRRIFDIYIQGILAWKDFNIQEIANGTGKDIKIPFNTTVTDNTLEIRLYWAGRGTTCVPAKGIYGPIISAISVCWVSKLTVMVRNRELVLHEPILKPKETSKTPIIVGVVVTSVLFLYLCVVYFFCWERCHAHKITRERGLKTSTFTYRQLKAATNNFDSANKLGEGGFGSVYKGKLPDNTIIAVKQLSSKSRQGNREFVNEVGVISGLEHPNLVKIFGCCVEGNQLMVVYEYLENNSLAHALYSSKGTLKLNWTTRQKICVGIARGLAFLHEESTLRIVHRDIKATNVLLDRELNAKISDFGLAKLKEDDNSHISTRIAGTIGYMAPEYALWGYLTEKADIYSFGVVALEIVSGRSNASHRPNNEFISLLELAFDLQQKGKLMEIVDPKLENEFNKDEVERMMKVALLCSNGSPARRPTMSEVVSMLESQTIIPEVILDPNIYGSDLELYQMNQNLGGSPASMFSLDKTGTESSATCTSANDL